MKRLLFISLLLLIAASAFSQVVKTSTKSVAVIVDGSAVNGVNFYDITDKTKFISVKDMASIYNGTVEYKPVSSSVALTLNNKNIVFKANSADVTIEKKSIKMPMPSRLIKNELYISPDFLTTEDFSNVTGAVTSWNKDSKILTITHTSNISSIRYFTAPDSTRVIIELTENLPYTITKDKGAILVTINKGKIQRGLIYTHNGSVEDIFHETEGRSAIIRINLAQTPKSVRSLMIKNPYRIVVDIANSKEVDITSLPGDQSADNIPPPAPPEGQLTVSEIVDTVPPANTDASTQTATGGSLFDTAVVIDDSYEIIDDTATFAGVMPAAPPIVQRKDPNVRRKIIVIDAGHGGEDPGAIGPNATKEKDLNLGIALELKKLLDADDNYEVVLTRKDDKFIPLAERTNIANENNADLFISIHCNANFDKAASGFEIYFLSEKATDSEAAATATLENSVIELEGAPTKKRALLQDMLWSMALNEYINDSSELAGFIASETPPRLQVVNRGVKQASFYVLRGSKMPAVLVESAFVSNFEEEAKLNTAAFKASVADSIYEGIKKFYARKEKANQKK